MAIRKLCQLSLLRNAFLSLVLFMVAPAQAETLTFQGQSIQIYTYLRSIAAKPIWLLILRDEQNGQVLPYLYDVRNYDNFWLALTLSHTYRITTSTLTFQSQAVIPNFCNLEDGVIDRESMSITVSGDLKPDSQTLRCHAVRYKDFPIPIVNAN